jgi:p-aminobenzoyl-glutamate transporter AbgT
MTENGKAGSVHTRGAVNRFLDLVERIGNALPDPTTLFALLVLAVVLLSGLAAQFDLAVAHPRTGKIIEPVTLLSALINLVMGSASAKWALMALVFVPMIMLLGYPPEVTQAAYRIGDSVRNVISPMMSYFALIIAFVQRYVAKAGKRYVAKAGIGTLVSLMLPCSLTFMAGWTLLFIAWLLLGWPVGPGAPTSLAVGSAAP